MTSLNMAPRTEFELPRPRRKARRSCLYCQKAHKTCGNERPCGQCVKRKMPSQCVDGHRKPPKYLNGGTKKASKASSCRGVTSLQQTQHQKENILNTTSYDNEITRQQASDERHIPDNRSDPFEEVFDEVIDSTFFDEQSSFKFGNQACGGTIFKGNDNFMPFFSDAAYSTSSERSSSVSEDSEVGTPCLALDDSFGTSLAKIHMYAKEEPYSGFAISSGWSSTFFPHGIEEEPHGF
ncbi:hypothetical protein DTO013E5_2179 [Penicillium roqueforti]|uniref:Zn(2)-C6 fungal-type DNA-binding domain n=1 Tax=Penicillium roqueforti (strain FM164) TaxID=1365484 RepID=W6Q699_PENRF|nr:hypothetical protein CBS147355_8256 [Penicillium roqueforti]CDM31536.1 Zn(2)-C6 fungal-type DNA-binding domain [Penicillium roqueforti FM164]KAI2706232.1 hypothetical protein CBS147372_143 [Penicillium roqueforti]KAI2737913.1 hypothetical protein DTO012A1_7228 [Penicillium roqueforti]KAI2748550.1 hypothetical protein DTO013F2_6286 [Penicillium roqueforti]